MQRRRYCIIIIAYNTSHCFFSHSDEALGLAKVSQSANHIVLIYGDDHNHMLGDDGIGRWIVWIVGQLGAHNSYQCHKFADKLCLCKCLNSRQLIIITNRWSVKLFLWPQQLSRRQRENWVYSLTRLFTFVYVWPLERTRENDYIYGYRYVRLSLSAWITPHTTIPTTK